MYEYHPGAPVLILYADHNPDDRVLVAEALAEVSPEVRLVSVPDGRALLDYLSLNSQSENHLVEPMPDAILLEINMPKKSGAEALTAIKAHPRTNPIPVVVFSTYTSERDKRRALRLGADLFVRKPRSFEHLKATLREITEKLTGRVNPSSVPRAFPNLKSVSR
jgi:CheY-like chemotaxis protein